MLGFPSLFCCVVFYTVNMLTVVSFVLFCRAVLKFIERYDPNVALPESANMRDIHKWRSQKSSWVPFIISLDISVWETLKTVLDKDSAKELHFQQAPTSEVNAEPTGIESKSSANTEDTGNLFMIGFSSMYPMALIILFYSLLS